MSSKNCFRSSINLTTTEKGINVNNSAGGGREGMNGLENSLRMGIVTGPRYSYL